MGFSYLSAVLSTIEKQFGIRSKVWGVCKMLVMMCFVSGNCLGVFWQRDQSNLFHLRSSLPQQDSQKDPLDLGGDDVRCARSLSLRKPLLCKGDKTPMCNRTKDVLEANLQRFEILWLQVNFCPSLEDESLAHWVNKALFGTISLIQILGQDVIRRRLEHIWGAKALHSRRRVGHGQ